MMSVVLLQKMDAFHAVLLDEARGAKDDEGGEEGGEGAVLAKPSKGATEELGGYLKESFGNLSRIDYGTGQ
jgi:hypothetical protein